MMMYLNIIAFTQQNNSDVLKKLVFSNYYQISLKSF